jgi:hypothetical protein
LSSGTGSGTDTSTGGSYITAITKANPGVFTVSSLPPFAVADTVYVSGVGGMSQVDGNDYSVTSITAVGDGTFHIVLNVSGTDLDTSAFGTYTSGGSLVKVTNGGVSGTGVATCMNNLFDDGAYNTITWSRVANAQRYYVYKLSNGLFGYIGQTKDVSFVDDNIAADISKTPPIKNNPFASANNYPTATGYFEQRRCFAGTVNAPSEFWATKSATETSLSYSIPSRADDSIDFTIAARRRQAIRHIVPMANLILLTESGEWRVSPAGGDVLTPDVSVREQSAIGAADAPPVVVNNNLLFAAGRGGHVRELAYNFQVNGYLTGDISLRATHLFDGYSIVDMDYAKAPVPIVWAVSSSGNLLGLTYVPEQEVGAWHRHDTQGGVFEHIAVVPEGDEDVLYAVVNRGGTRFIERMATRANGALEDAFFVDCGLTQTFADPVTEISGLDHLDGQTVAILGDGAVFPQQVVTGGAVTVDQPVSKVTVGLPIVADAKTLPLALQIDGYGQGRMKNVSQVWLRVFASSGVKAGPTTDRLTEYKQRKAEVYGTAPDPVTDEINIVVSPSWSSDGGVCVRQDQPLPLTILSMTIEFSVGGG